MKGVAREEKERNGEGRVVVPHPKQN